MSSESKDKHPAADEQAIPASVIAQAEAAIYGNLEIPGQVNDSRTRPTVAEQSGKHGTREKRSATTTSGRHLSRPTFARSATRLVFDDR